MIEMGKEEERAHVDVFYECSRDEERGEIKIGKIQDPLSLAD